MQAGEALHNPVPRAASNLNKIIGMRINLHERARGDRKETSDPLVLDGITIEFSVDECDDKALGVPSRNISESLRLASTPSGIQRKADSQKTPPSPTSLIKGSPPRKTKMASRNASRRSESARSPKNQTLMNNNDQVIASNNCGNPPGMRRALTSTAPSTTAKSSNAPIVSGSNVESLLFPSGTRHHNTSTHDEGSKPSLHASVDTGSNVKHFIGQGTGMTHFSDDRAASDADRARRRMERNLLQEKKRLHEERRNASLNQLRRPPQSSTYPEQSSSTRSLDVNDLNVPRPLGGRSSCAHAHSDTTITSILKQGRFSLADSSSSFKQQRQEDSQASLSSSRVRFQADESLSLLSSSALMFSESCISLSNEASGLPPDLRRQGNNHAINMSDDNNGSRCQHGKGTIKAESRLGAQDGNHTRESRPCSSTLGGSPLAHSSETRRFGLPPPQSAGRQLTPQEHDQLAFRQEELQRQRHARQQLQQQEKTSRRGLFGRKAKPEPESIDTPPLTDHQRRMAAAQAAFAMIGGDHG